MFVIEDYVRFVDYEVIFIYYLVVDVVNLVMLWSSCDGFVGVFVEFFDVVCEGFLDGFCYVGFWLVDELMIGLVGIVVIF